MSSPFLLTAMVVAAAFATCSLIPTAGGLKLLVRNTANATEGGRRFDREIGRSGAAEILKRATKYIWKVFRQPSPSRRKRVRKISLLVESMGGAAYAAADEIHLSAEYVGNYSGDVKREIAGVLYHELTHVWQWDGRGNAPSGLIEGIADYVRLSAGLAPPHWVRPGSGDRWDEGYAVTAYFLQYCEGLRSGFVARLNAKLARGWSLCFFPDLLGKSVDDLWKNYKAKYGFCS